MMLYVPAKKAGSYKFSLPLFLWQQSQFVFTFTKKQTEFRYAA